MFLIYFVECTYCIGHFSMALSIPMELSAPTMQSMGKELAEIEKNTNCDYDPFLHRHTCSETDIPQFKSRLDGMVYVCNTKPVSLETLCARIRDFTVPGLTVENFLNDKWTFYQIGCFVITREEIYLTTRIYGDYDYDADANEYDFPTEFVYKHRVIYKGNTYYYEYLVGEEDRPQLLRKVRQSHFIPRDTNLYRLICKNLGIIWANPVFDCFAPVPVVTVKTPLHYRTLFEGKNIVKGHKKAKHNNNECIVELDIPTMDGDEELTNMSRDCNPEYAYFRCKIARVVNIYNINNPNVKYETAKSIWGSEPPTYRIGRILVIHHFDPEKKRTCSTGVHFFTNLNMALLYPHTGYDHDGQRDCMYA